MINKKTDDEKNKITTFLLVVGLVKVRTFSSSQFYIESRYQLERNGLGELDELQLGSFHKLCSYCRRRIWWCMFDKLHSISVSFFFEKPKEKLFNFTAYIFYLNNLFKSRSTQNNFIFENYFTFFFFYYLDRSHLQL